ncbi:uncharacterized protein N0V89_002529 [Didymosphaeria variabile]|uniref:FAD-binding domain-containing protein n=1 Tax=Didymosphaeria variabile TaxID=1932322 RepID=A0A9W9CEF8_9PLEO|nr:uncharacterized protein N0V89_002529 [Didymosphaeria variabile]KAJ4357952.1 hypothetical protein N0V89_002529 [Didymosphaeria variabile]
MADGSARPVIIVGAGISGLLLAQYLTQSGIPFRIFERREDLATTNVGWGLTLSWSLPTLRNLLPAPLRERLPEAYVDSAAVERGEASAFPFFDLSTGELKAKTPLAPESQRIRVSRERFRKLLATDITIEWGETFTSYDTGEDCVSVRFEDGSQCVGCLLVGCDGAHSRVRRILLPKAQNNHIPIRVMGTKVHLTPSEIEPLRNLDSFFLQATSSRNNTFTYFSVLDAPGDEGGQTYTAQFVVSWPYRKELPVHDSLVAMPTSDTARLELLKTFAETWAEPIRSFALNLPNTVELKPLELSDWPPPRGIHDRGDGANHSIQDVQEIARKVAPMLSARSSENALRAAIDRYENEVTARCRPAVLASRQAALDAHEYGRINASSPLLSPRVMKLEFNE